MSILIILLALITTYHTPATAFLAPYCDIYMEIIGRQQGLPATQRIVYELGIPSTTLGPLCEEIPWQFALCCESDDFWILPRGSVYDGRMCRVQFSPSVKSTSGGRLSQFDTGCIEAVVRVVQSFYSLPECVS